MEIFQLNNFTLELVDKPAETLEAQEKQQLIRDSIIVARRGFRNEGVTKSDIISHAIDVSSAIYLRDRNRDLVAFASSIIDHVMGRTIVYLKGIALVPEYQGHGFYSPLIAIRVLFEAERHDSSELLIGTRTQSPIVYYAMSQKLGLYPKIDQPTPEDLKSIAEVYANIVQEKHSDFRPKHSLEFDRDKLVVRRAYGGVNENGEEFGFCMYGKDIPWHREDAVNQFVRDNLDMNNGDAFILVGPFSRENCLAMLGAFEPLRERFHG